MKLLISISALTVVVTAHGAPARPNVLALVFDDLRPWFKPFSNSGIAAPNFASLAAGSLVFNSTFVQQAVCGPSRNSFLTGRRAASTRTWNFKTSFRTSGADTKGVPGSKWRTMPQAFKEAGYLTIGMGKVFHPNSPAHNDCPRPRGEAPNCPSWTTAFHTNAPRNITLDKRHVLQCTSGRTEEESSTSSGVSRCEFTYVNPNAQIFIKRNGTLSNGTRTLIEPACADLADEDCTDYWLADAAVAMLPAATSVTPKQPFFMMVGFHKPHPFWDVPQRFQDEYATSLPLPRPAARTAPVNMPTVAYYSCDALMNRTDLAGPHCDDPGTNPYGGGQCRYITPDGNLPDDLLHHVRAGYAGTPPHEPIGAHTLIDDPPPHEPIGARPLIDDRLAYTPKPIASARLIDEWYMSCGMPSDENRWDHMDRPPAWQGARAARCPRRVQ